MVIWHIGMCDMCSRIHSRPHAEEQSVLTSVQIFVILFVLKLHKQDDGGGGAAAAAA